MKRKNEEIERKAEEIIGKWWIKKHLSETDEKLKKEMCKISKTAWYDFVNKNFEIKNNMLGLKRDIYFNLIKFLNSSILKKVWVNFFFLIFYLCFL
jgi:hypothetical protein